MERRFCEQSAGKGELKKQQFFGAEEQSFTCSFSETMVYKWLSFE
ncbi:hypothetical protein [Desulfosediminicola flagellatus]|nr:hypothetical protein [Desulfosediminicola flagellatus]